MLLPETIVGVGAGTPRKLREGRGKTEWTTCGCYET